jgi:hypothetical protein
LQWNTDLKALDSGSAPSFGCALAGSRHANPTGSRGLVPTVPSQLSNNQVRLGLTGMTRRQVKLYYVKLKTREKALALFAAFPARLGGKGPELFSGFQSDGLCHSGQGQILTRI